MPIPAPRGGVFQSTLPAGGSDHWHWCHSCQLRHFNPRSPQGERLSFSVSLVPVTSFQSTLPAGGATPHAFFERLNPVISIHAPRRGSDQQMPDRRRNCSPISIHAPRRGSDSGIFVLDIAGTDFNPRSPQGERLTLVTLYRSMSTFQSTLPAGGATGDVTCGT